MKTKVFEPGAICVAVALLFVLSLPAYAKSGGSSAAHTRVGKTSKITTAQEPMQQRLQQKLEVKGKSTEMLSNTQKKVGKTSDTMI